MKFTLCKLIPKGPLHLGTKEGIQEESDEYIHSDTLFSAICNCFRLIYGKEDLENLLKLYLDRKPPFILSSAFPFVKDILLLPMPKSFKFPKEKENFNKVEFIGHKIFEKIINGEDISEWLEEENLCQEDRVLLPYPRKNKDPIQIWEVHSEVPHVVIDRKTNASNIFYSSEVHYLSGCGLFFLIDWKTEEYKDKVMKTIKLLGEEGIGGKRSSGKGLFKLEESELVIEFPAEAEYFLTLSLYYPLKEEVQIVKEGWYELIKRGGWIYSLDSQTLRRKSIRMFLEGSVFPDIGNKGELKDVTPEVFKAHRVYRYGIPFKIPIKIKK